MAHVDSVASPDDQQASRSRAGVGYALSAFFLWGAFPLYFHALSAVPSLEVLCYRIIGSAVILSGWTLYRGKVRTLIDELCNLRRMMVYVSTTLLISLNWWLYIWAVQQGRLMEASLGYYINPLVSVMLGVIFLRERLNRQQWLAIAVATGGVLWLVAVHGVVPWIALVLALSFGAYGLVRKMAGFDAVLGLTVETVLLAPFAALAIGLWVAQGQSSLGAVSSLVDALLLLAGVATVVPLVLFLEAGLRLKLATLGIIQYISPTLQFLLAVFLFHEPFDSARGVTFACIWLALALYTVDALRQHRLAPITPEAE